ncbi:hypothetical protein M514_11359 [Trichuris suis]|uniref:Uncharacterized protein n=1 Tax=Trichuris suis TaxID=68888 RepID=A0A085NDF9_9BILA
MESCWSLLVSAIILAVTLFFTRLIITRRGRVTQNSVPSTPHQTTPVADEKREFLGLKTNLKEIQERNEDEEENEEEEDIFIPTRRTRRFVIATTPTNESSNENKSMYDEETKEKAKVVIRNAIISKQLREL